MGFEKMHIREITVIFKLLFCCCQSQHHDDEKRALSREIIVLNNHLMEAKLTIEKLQEDNVSEPRFTQTLLSVYRTQQCTESIGFHTR